MSCVQNCQLCPRFTTSVAVTFAADTLTINIPADSYSNRQKVCLVVAQAIPAATTITAPVVVTIGTGTVEYPLVDRCGTQLTAAALRTRTLYHTVVNTNAAGGIFKIYDRVFANAANALPAIDGTAPAAEGGDGG